MRRGPVLARNHWQPRRAFDYKLTMAMVTVRLLLVLWLFCDVLVAETELELTSLDAPSFILPGTEIHLKCKVYQLQYDAFTQGKVISFVKDQTIQLGNYNLTSHKTDSSRFTIRGVNRTFCLEVTFTITGITQEDDGHYQCVLVDSKNDDWLLGSQSVNLQVMKVAPLEYPKCSSKQKNGKIELTCEAKNVVPRPTMKWYKRNESEFAEIETTYGGGYKVKIEKDINDFNDSFVCKYSYFDSVNSDNRSCWIGKPKLSVISTGGSLSHTIGDDVDITFIAFANPQMTKPMNCSWNYRGGTNSFHATYEGNTKVMVRLSNVQIAMSGTVVTCAGINAIGTTRASFTLLVEDVVEKNLTSSLTTDKVYLSVGQSTTFNCETGFIPPVQRVNYEWSFHGMPVKVNNDFWEGRFNETQIDNQLVLNAASLDDNGTVISCRVHYNGKTLISSETKIVVCSNPVEQCQSSKEEPCQCHSPLVEGILIIMGVLVCTIVILKLLCCTVSRLRKPTTTMNIDYIGDGMRTSSFASSASESQSDNSSQLVHLRHDRSPILKRSVSLPSSRNLPSIPLPTPTLPPVHEYEKTPKSDTYSFIKSETEPKESSQAYMDMAAGKEMAKVPSTLQKPHPLMVSIDNAGETHPHSGETAPCGGASAATAEEWYLEAKRPQDSSVQYHDLEDLYRETAKNNVYHPRDK